MPSDGSGSSGCRASGCEEVIVKLSAEELDREPVLSSSFCSDYSDDFTAGSSLPSSGRASPSPDARANAAAARLALRELLFGDDCGTNAQAAEGLFDARAKPAQVCQLCILYMLISSTICRPQGHASTL